MHTYISEIIVYISGASLIIYGYPSHDGVLTLCAR